MGKQVYDLTKRALVRGRAIGGPWEIDHEGTQKGGTTRLYHWSAHIATANRGRLTITPRPGFDLAITDVAGIGSFADALGIPREEVIRAKKGVGFSRQAYGEGATANPPFPRRRSMMEE